MTDPRELNNTQRRLARHALGLRNAKKRSYRNRYCSPPKGEAFNAWLGLEQRGLAISDPPQRSGNVMFYLTQVGAEAALEPGETLCPEDFPREPAP